MNILIAGRIQTLCSRFYCHASIRKEKNGVQGGKGTSQMIIVVFMLIVMVIMDDDVVRDWAPPKSFCRKSYDMWCQPKWWNTAPRI